MIVISTDEAEALLRAFDRRLLQRMICTAQAFADAAREFGLSRKVIEELLNEEFLPIALEARAREIQGMRDALFASPQSVRRAELIQAKAAL
jgi:hypothetical protein